MASARMPLDALFALPLPEFLDKALQDYITPLLTTPSSDNKTAFVSFLDFFESRVEEKIEFSGTTPDSVSRGKTIFENLRGKTAEFTDIRRGCQNIVTIFETLQSSFDSESTAAPK